MARIVEVEFKGISPYSQSKHIVSPKADKETHEDFEKRTWRERMHVTEDGYVFIPPMAFKNALSESAKFTSTQIPGKGKATYTKHFEAGVLVCDPVVLAIKAEAVPGEWLFVPSDGKRGGGSRVMKCFPVIHEWSGVAIFHVLDDTITGPVFEKTLEEAGSFIGLGRFRPRNNGYYGRFEVTSFEWS